MPTTCNLCFIMYLVCEPPMCTLSLNNIVLKRILICSSSKAAWLVIKFILICKPIVIHQKCRFPDNQYKKTSTLQSSRVLAAILCRFRNSNHTH